MANTPAQRGSIHVISGVVWLAFVAGLIGLVSFDQASARRELERRFTLRAVVGAHFVQTWVDDLFRRQEQVASTLLSSRAQTAEDFRLVALSLGYDAAVLLDDQGRLLSVTPPNPDLLGQDLGVRYEHLREAIAGRRAISSVVPSAAEGRPIVAFALPFDTPTGRRVFSGGYDLSRTPLAAFLDHAVPIVPNHTDLIGVNSAVVASEHPSDSPDSQLRFQDTVLASALLQRPAGRVTLDGDTWYFTSAAVPGTPWRLVLAAPTERLYSPVQGGHALTRWLLAGALVAGSLVIVVLLLRLTAAADRQQRALADIAARKEVESELTTARDAALAASKMKSQFLTNTSHEIRTPLTVVLGMNELLLDTDLDQTQRVLAERVHQAGTGLVSIVQDLLDFARMDATGVRLEISDVELRPLLEQVAAPLRDSAQAKGLELLCRCESAVPTVVRGDPRRLHQLLLTLASNAVKFTERGRVVIAARVPEGTNDNVVRFEVFDTGIGIATTDQGRLYEPFSQVDAADTRAYGGMGLGLALAAELARAMDSTIMVDSAPGRGSTFWFDVAFEACLPDSHAGSIGTDEDRAPAVQRGAN